MPELPEVETTLRAIKKFQGQNLTDIKVHNRNLRWTIVKDLEKNSRNQKLINLHRRAKYIVFELENTYLLLHLGMSGSLRILKSEDNYFLKHDHIEFIFDHEKIIYNETCVGAENDLERATSIARKMVTHWGMSPKIGPVSYKTSDEDPFLGREIHQSRQFSEHTQELIDEEVARILLEADQKSEQLLREHRVELEKITKALLEHEELGEKELTDLIGPSIQAKMNPKPNESDDSSDQDNSEPTTTSEEDEATESTVNVEEDDSSE